MQVKIKETGVMCELSLWDPVTQMEMADDMVYCGDYDHDDDGIVVMSSDDFDWWVDLLATEQDVMEYVREHGDHVLDDVPEDHDLEADIGRRWAACVAHAEYMRGFDPDTSTLIGEYDSSNNGIYPRDHAHCEESLYKTGTGEYFLSGHGGPRSRYAKDCIGGGWSGGSGIIPLTKADALEWCESHLDVDDVVAEFGGVEVVAIPVS